MAVYYIKYRIQFKDVDEKEYRVDIYGHIPTGTPPSPIILTAGESPLTIDEDNSDDFFTPIRTQTGNLTICTKIEPQEAMPNGGTLDLANIIPSNNTDVFVSVQELYYPATSGVNPYWTPIWNGYLSCEMYNQSYTDLPENIQLPIISVLEAWKSIPYTLNADVISISTLINRMVDLTPLQPITYVRYPSDCADFLSSLINTSIFIKKEEYENEEFHVYKIVGSSCYDILETICKFMGWTARENGFELFLEKAQGYGLLDNTETMEMAELSWRGTDHQISRTVGAKSVKVITNLDQFDVKMEIPEMSAGNPNDEQYQEIGSPYGTQHHWVYFLPSLRDDFYSNLTFHYYAGDILLGSNQNYSFSQVADTIYMSTVIHYCIPYANMMSRAFDALTSPSDPVRIYGGAFLCKLEIKDSNDGGNLHPDAKDGMLVSLFPGAYDSVYSANLKPIFEMRSVQAFASLDEGWFNIDADFSVFYDDLDILGTDHQCRLVMELQVGDRYLWYNDNQLDQGWRWSTSRKQFFPEYKTEGFKFKSNWSADMDIDEVSGLCVPTYYEESGVKKFVMGEMVLRIYPETKFNTIYQSHDLGFDFFFKNLNVNYYPKKSVIKTDRNNNTYYSEIGAGFPDDKSIDNNIASYLRNNPSPSLLYQSDGTAYLQKLTYQKADNTTEQRRPESDLLNRMEDYYNQPRTILDLRVEHIEGKQLPLLRLNGLGDGKVYLPLSESRDLQTKESTIRCFELPYQEPPSES